MWEIMKDCMALSIVEHYQALTQMRLVCRRWTRILEAMPQIWVNLSLGMNETLIDLALSRSIPIPLTITGHLFSSPALDKLLQHIHRWKYLDVYLDDDVTMGRFAGHSAPLLEELRFDHLLPTPPTIPFNGTAPMLRILRIRSYGVQWSTLVLSNLQELVLVDVKHGVPKVDTFLKVLSNSPQLTRLRVRNTHLTKSPSSQTRVSLPCLSFLELEYLGRGILKQLLESIHLPTSTKCWFSLAIDDYQSPSIAKHIQLEPIGQRLAKLADISNGTKSTLTLRSEPSGWGVRVTYEGEADQLGALNIDVEEFPRSNLGFFEYFASQLGQGGPNLLPPMLHIVNPPDLTNSDNQLEIIKMLHNHLPDTDEILIEDASFGSIADAFNTLFPSNPASRPFPRLSTLIIRESMHEGWAHWLLGRQKRPEKRGDVDPLPLNTLKIGGGAISAEKVERLKKLVPDLALDRVEIR